MCRDVLVPWDTVASLLSSSGVFCHTADSRTFAQTQRLPLASPGTTSPSPQDAALRPCSTFTFHPAQPALTHLPEFPNCLWLRETRPELPKNSPACFRPPLDVPAFILNLTTEPPSPLNTTHSKCLGWRAASLLPTSDFYVACHNLLASSQVGVVGVITLFLFFKMC